MNLQESTLLSYKTELKIGVNSGLAQPCFEQPGPGDEVPFTSRRSAVKRRDLHL